MSNLTDEFVDSIDPPNCIFCGKAMQENHSTYWTGMRSVYTRIEFRYGNPRSHSFALYALTPEDWERYQLKLSELKGAAA